MHHIFCYSVLYHSSIYIILVYRLYTNHLSIHCSTHTLLVKYSLDSVRILHQRQMYLKILLTVHAVLILLFRCHIFSCQKELFDLENLHLHYIWYTNHSINGFQIGLKYNLSDHFCCLKFSTRAAHLLQLRNRLHVDQQIVNFLKYLYNYFPFISGCNNFNFVSLYDNCT